MQMQFNEGPCNVIKKKSKRQDNLRLLYIYSEHWLHIGRCRQRPPNPSMRRHFLLHRDLFIRITANLQNICPVYFVFIFYNKKKSQKTVNNKKPLAVAKMKANSEYDHSCMHTAFLLWQPFYCFFFAGFHWRK